MTVNGGWMWPEWTHDSNPWLPCSRNLKPGAEGKHFYQWNFSFDDLMGCTFLSPRKFPLSLVFVPKSISLSVEIFGCERERERWKWQNKRKTCPDTKIDEKQQQKPNKRLLQIIWPFIVICEKLSSSICSPYLIEFIAKFVSRANDCTNGQSAAAVLVYMVYRFFFSSLHHLRHTQTSLESAVCPIFICFFSSPSTRCRNILSIDDFILFFFVFVLERLISDFFRHVEMAIYDFCKVEGGNFEGSFVSLLSA